MKQQMLTYLITTLMNSFIKQLNPDGLKAYLDSLIDIVEKNIEESETPLDDTVLPGLRFIREFFDIPDLPDMP